MSCIYAVNWHLHACTVRCWREFCRRICCVYWIDRGWFCYSFYFPFIFFKQSGWWQKQNWHYPHWLVFRRWGIRGWVVCLWILRTPLKVTTNCKFEKFKAEVKIYIHYILFIKVVNEQIPTREIQTWAALLVISLQFSSEFLLLNC